MTIYYILFIHWVADFVCQSDWMAKNKSSSNVALSLHISTYTLIFTVLTGFSIKYSVINGLAHLGIDYVTSRLSSRQWQQGKVHNFFVIVGLDQMLHVMTLVYTMDYL